MTIQMPAKHHSLQPCKVVLHSENLCKNFGGQNVLQNVSLTLYRGEVVLLRGLNGSGKTTLLNILTGNLEPDTGSIDIYTENVQRRFCFPPTGGQKFNPLRAFTPEHLAQLGIGRMWQDVRLFSTQNLQDNIAIATTNQLGENPLQAVLQPLKVRRQTRRIYRTALLRLESLGLLGRESSSANRISLGQSKRVAIARTVQAGAKVLFLDEPLSGLDATGIEEVLQLLAQLIREDGLALVIVEHVFNINRVMDLATTVWTLESGKVRVESPDQVRLELNQSLTSGIKGWIQNLAGIDGQIKERQLGRGAVLSVVKVGSAPVDQAVLEIEDLVVYRGNRLIIGERLEDGRLGGLSFKVHKDELVVLQAPNGYGKSTLLEAIAGLLPIQHGTIKLNGKSVHQLPAWTRAKLGLSFLQSRDNTFPNLTVRDALKLARVNFIPDHLRHLLKKPMASLSGGEKQKVVTICALNGHSFTVGILDEPLSALDANAVESIEFMFSNFLGRIGLLIAVPTWAE
jgi:ABC-type branched-subunit amino acid transport system ATPase component